MVRYNHWNILTNLGNMSHVIGDLTHCAGLLFSCSRTSTGNFRRTYVDQRRSTKLTTAEQSLKTLLSHIAKRYHCHDSNIANCVTAELKVAMDSPVVKQPQRVAQCKELDDLLIKPSSPSLIVLAETQHALHWADSGGARKPGAIQRRLAFSELIGPNGMFTNTQCRVGLFLQCAQTIYPAHMHAAEELFLVLSGTALWQRGAVESAWYSADTFIHHTSWESHAMTTGSEPMLAIWCWVGDIRFDQYRFSDY